MTKEVQDQLRVSFQKLSPVEGDIIVMRFPKGSSSEERGYLAEMLSQLNDQNLLPPNVAILILPEGYNLEVLQKDQMSALGWERKLSS